MSTGIVIVDYGMGNIHSVQRKLYRLKVPSELSSSPEVIRKADKLILPGVGHFGKAMQQLTQLGLTDALNETVLQRKQPVLGICLGMQLMAQKSEEGNTNGLGWLQADVAKFQIKNKLHYKIPHTGWNQLNIAKPSLLLKDIPDRSEFYFVHAYHYATQKQQDVLGTTDYEYSFVSAVEKENIFGVQFHPEKSHDSGETLLKNFTTL